MFGSKKKKQQDKKQGHVDKVLMGMIVGGAIGSVLGVGLAPKKGSETRKDIGDSTNKAVKEVKQVFQKTKGGLFGFLKKKKIKISGKKRSKFGNKVIPEEK